MSTLTVSPSAVRPRAALRWLASFVGFPLGGLAAMLLVGPVDSAPAAAAGGLLSGAVVGLAQAVVLRHRLGRLAAVWPIYLAGAWAPGWTVTTQR
ncbi:MAG TPA: hypothetical protein DEQ43_16580 [Nocardioides bacterium]|uniref:hypothetical protein n=1 Tax=uncultured Nocardioides sp. TaxID=198441 RepID=UPI000EE8C9AF|nr:hypothetical protein [uncultured Nocardioides sp.]HCB05835.1 hypothetical protein [Nocardioides sp.]